MSDGIIQKAFNNYYKQTYLSVGYKYELEQIKQELIEKIKHIGNSSSINEHHSSVFRGGYDIATETIKTKLIGDGDNNE